MSRVNTGMATLSVSSHEMRLFAAAVGHAAMTKSTACA